MTDTNATNKPALPATTEERNRQQKQNEQDAQKQQQQQQHEQEAAQPKQLDDLHTEHGDTTIADQVVEKIAGIATREVSGVYAMGSAAGRAISNLTSKLSSSSRSSVSSGVTVEKGERQTAIDVSVVVDYGVSIVEVSDNIRQSVIDGVEHATGLEVVEVNIDVTDVHLPEEDSDDDEGDNGTNRSRERQSERLA